MDRREKLSYPCVNFTIARCHGGTALNRSCTRHVHTYMHAHMHTYVPIEKQLDFISISTTFSSLCFGVSQGWEVDASVETTFVVEVYRHSLQEVKFHLSLRERAIYDVIKYSKAFLNFEYRKVIFELYFVRNRTSANELVIINKHFIYFI